MKRKSKDRDDCITSEFVAGFMSFVHGMFEDEWEMFTLSVTDRN